MNSHLNQKTRALVAWGVAMVAIILLANSISSLDFNSGKRFRPVLISDTTSDANADTKINYLLIAIKVLSALLILLAISSILYLLFTRKTRLKVIFHGFCLVLYCLLFSLLIRIQLDMLAESTATFPYLVFQEGEVQRITFNPNPSAYLVWAVNLGLALLGVLIFSRLVSNFLRRRRNGALLQLAKEAQTTLQELRSGADLGSTVLDCYQNMINAVSRERGLSRPQDMTPHEFVSFLVQAGLPEPPIKQLTLLFERVRYGAKIADAESDQMAVESLEAIVAFCRGRP